MHYLDDFIDLLEQMPQMVRDKCTQLRELDLSLHNSSARLNQQVKEFFSKSEKMSQDEKNNLFQRVMCDYYRLLEDADERVRLAQEMLDYVRCHLVAINEELVKYQAELEADRPGITVILQKLKKQVLYLEEACVAATKGLFLLPPASPANFPGGSAIATAASQTITATQQMQQGWRSTSLKASYEALSLAVQEVDFGKKELVVAARTAVAAVQNATKKKKKKQKRKSPVGASMLQCMDTTAEVTPEWQKEWVPAPDEPTYCTCKQVSYGNMVACDNETCEIEWFHYSCVGILAPPKGKWYCPQCSIAWTKSGSHKAG